MRSRSTRIKPLGPRARTRKSILTHGARPLPLCNVDIRRCGRNCGIRKGKPVPAALPVIEEEEEEVAVDKPTEVDAIFSTYSNQNCLQMFTEAIVEAEEVAGEEVITVASASPEVDSPPSSSSEGMHTGLLESYDADVEDFKAESSPPAPVFAGAGTGLGFGLGIFNVPQLTFQSTIVIALPESNAPRRPPLIRDAAAATTSTFSSSRRPPLVRGTITTSEFSSSHRPTLIRAPLVSSSFYTEKTSSVREPVKIKVSWKHRAKAIAKDTKYWFKMRMGLKAKAGVC